MISICCAFGVFVLQSLPEMITSVDADSDDMRPFNEHPNCIIKG